VTDRCDHLQSPGLKGSLHRRLTDDLSIEHFRQGFGRIDADLPASVEIHCWMAEVPAAACIDLGQGKDQVPYRNLSDDHHIQEAVGDIGVGGKAQPSSRGGGIEDKDAAGSGRNRAVIEGDSDIVIPKIS
jgi:hypothetical protein